MAETAPARVQQLCRKRPLLEATTTYASAPQDKSGATMAVRLRASPNSLHVLAWSLLRLHLKYESVAVDWGRFLENSVRRPNLTTRANPVFGNMRLGESHRPRRRISQHCPSSLNMWVHLAKVLIKREASKLSKPETPD
jgi:hypothetical protein